MSPNLIVPGFSELLIGQYKTRTADCNPSKCLSTWSGTNAKDLPVSLNGIVIDIANTMQLLSVSIDRDLNFNVHVKETVRKVSRKLQVPKRYKHFIPTHAKERLYLAYFLPHLTYCSTVWFHW